MKPEKMYKVLNYVEYPIALTLALAAMYAIAKGVDWMYYATTVTAGELFFMGMVATAIGVLLPLFGVNKLCDYLKTRLGEDK